MRLHQIEHKHIGYKIDRSRGVTQGIDEIDHSRVVEHRQSDVDHVDIVFGDEIGDIVDTAKHNLFQLIIATFVESIVEKGFNAHHQAALLMDFTCELMPQVVRAHNHSVANIASAA